MFLYQIGFSLLLTVVLCSVALTASLTEINSKLSRVFYGTFEFTWTEPDADGVKNKFDFLKTKLESRTNYKITDGQVIELESDTTLNVNPTRADILKYQETETNKLFVTFRIVFSEETTLTRNDIIDILNNDDEIGKTQIFAVNDPQEPSTTNVTKVYENAEHNILRYMNTSVQPCEDFYEYACGNFHEANDHQVLTTTGLITPDSQTVHRKFFQSETDAETDEPQYKKIARNFHSSCTEYFEATNQKMKNEIDGYINELLTKFGGLPLIKSDATTTTTRPEASVPVKSINAALLAQLQIMHADRVGISLAKLGTRIAPVAAGIEEPLLDQTSVVFKKYKHVVTLEKGVQMKMPLPSIQTALAKYTDSVDQVQMMQLEMLIKVLYTVDQGIDNIRKNGLEFNEPLTIEVSNTTYKVFKMKELMAAYSDVLKQNPDYLHSQTFVIDSWPGLIYFKDFLNKYEPFKELFTEQNLRNLYMTSFMASFNDDIQANIHFNSIDNDTIKSELIFNHCSDKFNNEMGLFADRIYVEEFFLLDSDKTKIKKEVLREMFGNVKAAYNTMLDSNSWLENNSKNYLKDKVTAIQGIMGYSEHLLNDTLFDSDVLNRINRHTKYLQFREHINLHNALQKFKQTQSYDESLRELLIGEGMRQLNAEFDMEHYVKIYAGIAHEPVIQTDAVMKAIEYGFGGFLIGHEIGHAFAPSLKIDQLGEWNEDEFDNRELNQIKHMNTCIIDQYDKFCPFDEDEDVPYRCVNGKMTMTDNIPDVLGVYTALNAYKALHLSPKRFKGLLADKSPEEIFFLAYAQGWCGPQNKEFMAVRLNTTNLHAPLKYRVNGAIQNVPAFGEIFNCPKNAKMAPTKYCPIWS